MVFIVKMLASNLMRLYVNCDKCGALLVDDVVTAPYDPPEGWEIYPESDTRYAPLNADNWGISFCPDCFRAICSASERFSPVINLSEC